MSTEIPSMHASRMSDDAPSLRLSHGGHNMLTGRDMPAQTESASVDDPRWAMAMRVRLAAECGELSNTERARLVELGQSKGMSPMHIHAIIGIIERANARGGFDMVAHDEIMRLPPVDTDGVRELSERARWLTFGALFAWALLIAALMQLVA